MSKAIETPEARSDRGRAMAAQMGGDLDGWAYHAECRAKLSSSEQAAFDLEFIGRGALSARAVAGVRPAVDLALAEMRKKLMLRLGRGRWGAL